MKTILKITAILLLVLFPLWGLGGCSNDDGPSGGNENQLVLTTAAIKVGKGQEVTFEVTAGGEAVSDAEILIDGSAIPGYAHVFNYTGTYEAIAQKEGFLDSEPLSIEVLEVQTDVYIAGYEYNGTNLVAKYWKNGTPVSLTNGSTYAVANSIFVANGNVYVAGVEDNGTALVATYWENGAQVNLTDGSNDASAQSIFVSNGDVHVAGYESNGIHKVAKYWINGVPVNLTNGSNYAEANSVFVSNGDVYVAGYEYNGSKIVAKYWNLPDGEAGNGTPTDLTDGTKNASANSIFVSNGDVYVAGYEFNGTNNVAKSWNLPDGEAGNGASVNLTDGTQNAFAESIFVSNDDVYVAGSELNGNYYMAKYWNFPAGGAGNGSPVNLTDGTNESLSKSVFVSDGDVYVAGREFNGIHNVAKYWINGTPENLTDGSQNATGQSIFVVRTLVE